LAGGTRDRPAVACDRERAEGLDAEQRGWVGVGPRPAGKNIGSHTRARQRRFAVGHAMTTAMTKHEPTGPTPSHN
jgi:hypothetical protein